jgi:hypothetical protein
MNMSALHSHLCHFAGGPPATQASQLFDTIGVLR